MKPRHILLYCATILLIEYSMLLSWLGLDRLYDVMGSYFGSGTHVRGSSFPILMLKVAYFTLPRLVYGQVAASVLLHLLALGRARGYAKVLKSSILVNAGTCVIFYALFIVFVPAIRGHFNLPAGGVAGWIVVGSSIVAPVIAMRFWRRALPAKEAE